MTQQPYQHYTEPLDLARVKQEPPDDDATAASPRSVGDGALASDGLEAWLKQEPVDMFEVGPVIKTEQYTAGVTYETDRFSASDSEPAVGMYDVKYEGDGVCSTQPQSEFHYQNEEQVVKADIHSLCTREAAPDQELVAMPIPICSRLLVTSHKEEDAHLELRACSLCAVYSCTDCDYVTRTKVDCVAHVGEHHKLKGKGKQHETCIESSAKPVDLARVKREPPDEDAIDARPALAGDNGDRMQGVLASDGLRAWFKQENVDETCGMAEVGSTIKMELRSTDAKGIIDRFNVSDRDSSVACAEATAGMFDVEHDADKVASTRSESRNIHQNEEEVSEIKEGDTHDGVPAYNRAHCYCIINGDPSEQARQHLPKPAFASSRPITVAMAAYLSKHRTYRTWSPTFVDEISKYMFPKRVKRKCRRERFLLPCGRVIRLCVPSEPPAD